MLNKSNIKDTLFCDFIEADGVIDESNSIYADIQCVIQFIVDQIQFDNKRSSNSGIKLLLNKQIDSSINKKIESFFESNTPTNVTSEYFDSNFFIKNPEVLFLVKF